MKVLIADKDSELRMLVSARLQARQYEVIETESSEEVMRIIDREAIDLIILSTEMERMSGKMLIEMIRQKSNFMSVPIILLTEEREIAELVMTKERGFDDFLTKPFNPLVL